MWRWSQQLRKDAENQVVFSTYVEVILTYIDGSYFRTSILHVCGGDPIICIRENQQYLYSPRMWRWSSTPFYLYPSFWVFSTYVEVILSVLRHITFICSILHVCGGDPIHLLFSTNRQEYSPRMWRWSSLIISPFQSFTVFSTYVEVILSRELRNQRIQGILHVCGGDPMQDAIYDIDYQYSPRMWRWSGTTSMWPIMPKVFSTYVEVIPDSPGIEPR